MTDGSPTGGQDRTAPSARLRRGGVLTVGTCCALETIRPASGPSCGRSRREPPPADASRRAARRLRWRRAAAAPAYARSPGRKRRWATTGRTWRAHRQAGGGRRACGRRWRGRTAREYGDLLPSSPSWRKLGLTPRRPFDGNAKFAGRFARRAPRRRRRTPRPSMDWMTSGPAPARGS